MSKLTDVKIRSLKPGSQERDGGDGSVVVVHPTGAIAYVLRTRIDGRLRKLTYPEKDFGLAKARKWKADVLLEISRGGDPVKAKKRAEQERLDADADTLRAISRRFFQLVGKDLRSLKWYQGTMERCVLPYLGDRPIDGIKRSEFVKLFDKIELGELKHPDTKKPLKGGKVMADAARRVAGRICSWHAARSDDFRSPFIRGMARVKPSEIARSRILTDPEIVAIWKATEDHQHDEYLAFVRFLLLTAARRDEAAKMAWSELDGANWELPARRNKAKVDFIRQLSPAALAVIQARPKFERSDWVFTTDGKKPLSGYSGRKAMFDRACGVKDWRLHDLRRTARSLMSRASISGDIGEICLGHALQGVRGVYDRHDYAAEKKFAFDALASMIDSIVNPPANNVRRLRG